MRRKAVDKGGGEVESAAQEEGEEEGRLSPKVVRHVAGHDGANPIEEYLHHPHCRLQVVSAKIKSFQRCLVLLPV